MTLTVLGAGHGRTGTASLKAALDRLGFGPCYHMMEVFKDEAAPARWIAACDGRADWEAIFAGYRSSVDWPGARFWRELADTYPDAKVILTVRDPDSWFRSTQQTIFARGMPPANAPDPFAMMIRKLTLPVFGERLDERERLIAEFNRHNAEVQATIAPERLLVYDVRQGWDPLCAFLGAPVPDEPFPAVNSSEEFVREQRGARLQQ